MISIRTRFIEFLEHGTIPAEKVNAALTVSKLKPDGSAWRTFVSNLLLWLGGLAMTFSVLFFFAFNWNKIGRFGKFGLVEGLIILTIAAYCWTDGNTAIRKALLLAASIFIGVLLALYGQTYQTGADPWQLFFSWALLMLPWTFIGRFSAIWIVWVLLINISIVLYHQAFGNAFRFMFDSTGGMLWMTFFFNTLSLVVWELLAGFRNWLSPRWAIRILAVGSGLPLTWLVLHAIFDFSNVSAVSGLAWAIWLGAMYTVYRKIRPDLFMLAGSCLSGIVVSVSLVSRLLLEDGTPGGFLFLALMVIGMGSGAAFWLKNIHQEEIS